MQKQTFHLTMVSVLITVLAVTLSGCGSGPTSSQGTGSGVVGGPGGGPAQAGGQSPPNQLTQLGIAAEPSQEQPRGLVLTGFLSSPEASPLGVIGVRVGDKIISCNGQQERIATRLVAALDGLQNRGEPVVLVVLRDGKEVRLERTEKLPGAGGGQSLE
jgi:S1-C subfamily serine protease